MDRSRSVMKKDNCNCASLKQSRFCHRHAASLPEQNFEFLGWDRHTEKVALHFVTMMQAQEGFLPIGFDPFGDYFESQIMRHGNDDLGDYRVIPVGGDVTHE